MHFSRTSDLIFFNSGALPNILHYITKVCAKNDVYIFVLRDSWPLYLKIKKFELYTAFQLKICNRQRGRQMSQKWAVFACEMHSTICVDDGFRAESPCHTEGHFGLLLMQIDPLLRKICTQNHFYIFVLIDLDVWSLTLNLLSLLWLSDFE